MFSNVLNLISLLGISVEYAGDQIFGIRRNEVRNLEVGAQNFLIKIGRVWILKRQVATHQGEQDDSARPNVHIRPMILLSSNHFRSCIAWRAACSLQ